MWFLTNANWSHDLNLTKAMRGVETSSSLLPLAHFQPLPRALSLSLSLKMGHSTPEEQPAPAVCVQVCLCACVCSCRLWQEATPAVIWVPCGGWCVSVAVLPYPGVLQICRSVERPTTQQLILQTVSSGKMFLHTGAELLFLCQVFHSTRYSAGVCHPFQPEANFHPPLHLFSVPQLRRNV